MAIISIVRQNGAVAFEPPTLNISAGDVVVWRNRDPDAQHWITRSGKERTFWFDNPLALFVDGLPADVTSEVLMESEDSISYECALHSGETGTIVVQ